MTDPTTLPDADASPSEAGGAQPLAATLVPRPKRADARRNYDKLVTAARQAFAERDTEASLEDIARRAGVGIGTLYRHFPTRSALLAAVYVDEVDAMARAAEDVGHLEPWEALRAWLHQYVGFAAAKRALHEQLLAAEGADAEVLGACRGALLGAGGGLLRRAQAAGEVRPDVTFDDVGRMVSGIALLRATEPEQVQRILDVALDGLRYRPAH
ncbi:MAG: TetR/AcrR family transcriptional regulator [Solirubrobacterales bacterium]|nr:TetR/AcrR family transcriptional regulator [Solirubrobacterales bacterium]